MNQDVGNCWCLRCGADLLKGSHYVMCRDPQAIEHARETLAAISAPLFVPSIQPVAYRVWAKQHRSLGKRFTRGIYEAESITEEDRRLWALDGDELEASLCPSDHAAPRNVERRAIEGRRMSNVPTFIDRLRLIARALEEGQPRAKDRAIFALKACADYLTELHAKPEDSAALDGGLSSGTDETKESK